MIVSGSSLSAFSFCWKIWEIPKKSIKRIFLGRLFYFIPTIVVVYSKEGKIITMSLLPTNRTKEFIEMVQTPE
jgi:hypothetical protein